MQNLVLLINYSLLITIIIQLYKQLRYGKKSEILKYTNMLYFLIFTFYLIRKFVFNRGLGFEDGRELIYLLVFSAGFLIVVYMHFFVKVKESKIYYCGNFSMGIFSIYLLQVIYHWHGHYAAGMFRFGSWLW